LQNLPVDVYCSVGVVVPLPLMVVVPLPLMVVVPLLLTVFLLVLLPLVVLLLLVLLVVLLSHHLPMVVVPVDVPDPLLRVIREAG
jgi:hypothetical protein